MSIWATLTYPFRRQPRRPLAARQPARPANREVPLGMEATDLTLVDRVNRRNDALERVNQTSAHRDGPSEYVASASTDVTPMPEDETYAARYHRAFTKKGSQT